MIETFMAVLATDLIWAMAITFAGGLMLGYTGWGGAMVSMPFLTILYGPVQALVIMIIGAVLLTAHLFPAAARLADWRRMTPMLIAMAVCVPIGNLLLFALEPNLIRRIIGWLVVGASILILSGWRYRGPQGAGASATTGVISGLINGFVGLGGPPPGDLYACLETVRRRSAGKYSGLYGDNFCPRLGLNNCWRRSDNGGQYSWRAYCAISVGWRLAGGKAIPQIAGRAI
jgi:hypothetical protein